MSSEVVNILYQDDTLLAVIKPAGWQSVVEHGGPARECWTSHVRRSLGLRYLAPAHRLDRDTSGVQLFALSDKILKKLEKNFRQRQTCKFYLAFCLGVPRNRTGVIRRNLSEWRSGRRPVQVVKGSGGLTAQTAYHVAAEGGEWPESSRPAASLLLLHPREGRTHQIRVHLQALGYPILGDDQYGERSANVAVRKLCGLARQALHAWRLSLPHPEIDKRLELIAPWPEDLEVAAKELFSGWPESLAQAAREFGATENFGSNVKPG